MEQTVENRLAEEEHLRYEKAYKMGAGPSRRKALDWRLDFFANLSTGTYNTSMRQNVTKCNVALIRIRLGLNESSNMNEEKQNFS